MHNNRLATLAGIAMLGMCFTAHVVAFNASRYATNSKLASGKWVKIEIATNGVHELTTAELAQMGFSNPANVRVYGSGGHMIDERLDGTAPDDLVKVPVARYGDKICFYGKGPVAFNMLTTGSSPRYYRTINPYSEHGYYFLTESEESEETIKIVEASLKGSTTQTSSYDYFYHEQELFSGAHSGKDLLGEPFGDNGITLNYTLNGLVENSSPIVVTTSVGALCNKRLNIAGELIVNGTTTAINFPTSINAINPPSTDIVKYNVASPYAATTPKQVNEKGKLRIYMSSNEGLRWVRLDYAILTYQRKNTSKNATNGQFRMGFKSLHPTDKIELNDTARNLVVWNIDNEASPVRYDCASTTNQEGEPVKAFTPGIEKPWSQFIAFDPGSTLLKITGFETVSTQNLHALETPDMVIVTNSKLMRQAERIAKLHRTNDNFVVHVIDQEQIFNEFSSGTQDAMAVRLMNKMFYDRNRNKFKYLLMFGTGSYDNRGITANRPNRVITYQSNNSNDETFSFVTDDFFGYLEDNSGVDITACMLQLGVGRIPSRNIAEAKSDVDKLINYVNNPDYGVWRNQALLTADTKDHGLHMFQAEGIGLMLDNELELGFVQDKSYVEFFQKASDLEEPGVEQEAKTAFDAKRHLKEALNRGQYFCTYVGHAGPVSLTKTSHMWTINDVNNVNYEHLPIVSTACCDVARYDSDTEGIAEKMFHKKNGGAIALLASSRAAFATGNDILNRAFVKALFKSSNPYTRLGDAYKEAKQSFGKSTNYNKMQFLLLGDPAMQINYPKPLFKLSSINKTTINNDSEICQMQPIEIVAHVMLPDGLTVNTSFNGDAYLSIYDKEIYFGTVTSTVHVQTVNRPINRARNLLTQVKGRVVNGTFKTSAILPLNFTANGNYGLLSLYAHRDNSDEMVNGNYSKLIIKPYNNTLAISDVTAPTINSIYFNEQADAAENTVIQSNSTLYINVTDDNSLNVQSVSIGTGMTLQLDGGQQSYNDINACAILENNGKEMNVAYPMTNMAPGNHTLTYTVQDVAGNTASKTIAFSVTQTGNVQLFAEENPVIDQISFNIEKEFDNDIDMTIKVTTAGGQLLWSKKTSNFPVTWNLIDNNGHKLPPGMYKFFGTYETAGQWGGTNINKLIILENHKNNL